VEDIQARIAAVVTSWEGVTEHDHRFGGRAFRLGRRELGHLHGDRLADLPFPKRIAAMLVETGRAEPHRFARGGWVSFPIRGDEDVDAAIELFRLSYERARVAAARSEALRTGRSSPRSPRRSSAG
jgi:Family of unknown function (DUF5519)